MECETLIVSDVHLGSAVSLAAALTHLLKNSTFKRLILLGDIFQDLDFSRLTSEHWKLISYIRKLSNPKRGIEVVWVEGNHDAGITHVMEHLLGVKVYQEYTWESGGKKCLAIHGHQYDNLWAGGTPLLGRIFTPMYLWMQHIDFVKKWLPRMLDKLHTHWERLDVKVAKGAMKHAAHVGADVIFCGHTHQVFSDFRDNVQYHNVGCWVNSKNGTYAALTKDGQVAICEYKMDERREEGHESPDLEGVGV